MLAEAATMQEFKPVMPAPRRMRATMAPICESCSLRAVCPSSGLSKSELRELDSVVLSQRRLKPGQALFRSGEAFQAVYLVRSGFMKTMVVLEDGREQVTGLYMPGEMLGMDGVASGRYASDAVALGDSDICVNPYERLQHLEEGAGAVQRLLHRMFSLEIVREQQMMLLLGSMRAEERVASFLLNLSERFTALGFSPSEFVLRMTREEIGSLLGLKLETVSRTLSRFHKHGLIEVEGRHVRIVRAAGLRGILAH